GAAVSRIRRYDLSGTTTMSVTDYQPQGHGAASRAGLLGGPAGPTGLYQLHYIVDRSVHSRERNFLWPRSTQTSQRPSAARRWSVSTPSPTACRPPCSPSSSRPTPPTASRTASARPSSTM